MHLQLAVTIRMLLGVRMLFPQSFEGGTHIVAVFFQCKSSSVVIALFSGTTRFLKLGVAKYYQDFCLAHGIHLAIKTGLQLRHALRDRRGYQQKNRHQVAKRFLEPRGYPHAVTFSLRACVARPCFVPEPARPDRDSCSGPARGISGRLPGLVSAASNYRSRAHG